MQLICEICDKTFQHKSSYKRHMSGHTDDKKYKCDDCEQRFSSSFNLNRHKLTHSETSFTCNQCNNVFKRGDKLKEHKSKCDGIEDMCFVETDSGFERRIVDCRLQNRLFGDVGYVLGTLAHKIEAKVKDYLKTFSGVKFNLWVECEFISPDGNVCIRNLKTSLSPAFRTSNIAQIIEDKIRKLVDECETCQLKGSGWGYNRLITLKNPVGKK